MASQFNTDLEGPITLNDNAFELSAYFLEGGEKFFKILSRYDDALALLGRENYRAGDTLKLILPFFLAYGVSNADMQGYSKRTLRLVPGAKEALSAIHKEMPTFIISTSYEPYVKAVCMSLNFPYENAYCTKVDLDGYKISKAEKEELKRLYKTISSLPLIEMPDRVASLSDLPSRDQEVIKHLDEIFWVRIFSMDAGRLLREVRPIGGGEKVEAIHDSLERTGFDLSELIYVGDSITDAEALALVKKEGGVAVSFNGNRYALMSAEIACLSWSAKPLYEIAKAFREWGKPKLLRLVGEGALSKEGAKLTTKIDEELIRESEALRKRLRGQNVGELG